LSLKNNQNQLFVYYVLLAFLVSKRQACLNLGTFYSVIEENISVRSRGLFIVLSAALYLVAKEVESKLSVAPKF